MIVAALRSAIAKIPTREERLGGQTFKYVKLSEVLDLLDTFRNAHEPSELRLLFNKGIGVQRGNGFSFAFPTEEDANQAFHYICDLGTLQTSQPPKSEGTPRGASGEWQIGPNTREPGCKCVVGATFVDCSPCPIHGLSPTLRTSE